MTQQEALARRARVLAAVRSCKVGYELSEGARATLSESLADGIEFDPHDDAAGTLYEACEIITDAAIAAYEGAISASLHEAEMAAILADPTAVHLNMLRGGIAKPSPANIWHLYGAKALLDAMPEEAKRALSTSWDAAREAAGRERFERALITISEGDVPRPLGKRWRKDGTPSKHDRCIHDIWLYEDCGGCISDFAADALKNQPEGMGGG